MLANALEAVRLNPVDDEAIRREELELRAVLDGLQRPNPGIELLLGELTLEGALALCP